MYLCTVPTYNKFDEYVRLQIGMVQCYTNKLVEITRKTARQTAGEYVSPEANTLATVH